VQPAKEEHLTQAQPPARLSNGFVQRVEGASEEGPQGLINNPSISLKGEVPKMALELIEALSSWKKPSAKFLVPLEPTIRPKARLSWAISELSTLPCSG